MTDRASSVTDEIRLRGLTVVGHHGVFEQEKRDGQPFVVDATLGVDTRGAARTDHLADTVDYGALADELAEIVAGPSFDLIETLAERLAETALARPGVHWVEIVVHKPQAPIARQFADVSVRIRRERPSEAS